MSNYSEDVIWWFPNAGFGITYLKTLATNGDLVGLA